MNRIYSLAALTSLTLCCSVGLVNGDPKLNAETPAADAKAMFENIDSLSDAIFQEASSLRRVAFRGLKDEGDFDGLDLIKEDVNRIGNEIRSLEEMQDSLAPWETQALAQTAPLMRELADNVDKAIQASNQLPMPTQSYVDATSSVAKYAEEVKILLRGQLKLENLREKELQLEHRLAESSGN